MNTPAPPPPPDLPVPSVPVYEPPGLPRLPELGELADTGHGWVEIVLAHAPAAVAITASVVAVLLVRPLLARRARRARHAGARMVTVLAPAGLDPADALTGGLRLWRDLTGTAPPAWRRALFGPPPHVGVEYRLTAGAEPAVRVWVPGGIDTH
ncbi:MAG: hypothetical protein GEV00_22665, partial [Actinophytocola sp.]|nr:hypothetical protein [Actinophytocola sp.]